jgi:ABC-type transport system involved in multi-copper enzyme maturation permease subunit
VDSRGLSRIYAVARNTFRETVRERVLYNLALFALLMIASGLLLGQISVRQDEKILKDIALGAMDFFGTLIAIFMGVQLVSKEIERRSLHPLLAKPLSRTEFLLGKYAGLCFTLMVNVGVMSLGLFATLLATRRPVDPHLLRAVFPLWLGLAMTVALSLLFSSISSSGLSVVLTITVVLAGRLSDVVRNMRDVAPGVPRWLIDGIYFALPNFQNLDFKNRVVYGDPVPWTDLGWATVYAAVYTTMVLGVAVTAFRSRDFQ